MTDVLSDAKDLLETWNVQSIAEDIKNSYDREAMTDLVRLFSSLITTIESQKEEIERWQSLRPEVQWFAEQMEISLRGNEYKGGWKDSHQSWLLGELHRNAGKLFDSRYNIRRAVNVANFAMMIADNTRTQEGDK